MAKKRSRGNVFVETDGQVFLVRERGKYRFPRADEGLPFRTDPNGIMGFGEDRVLKRTPRLDHHPEEWMGRDSVFERTDIDPLVKRAIYTTMIRCVSEVILSKGPRVLMVKAVRGFSKGYWNIPGGFMDYGEGLRPERSGKRWRRSGPKSRSTVSSMSTSLVFRENRRTRWASCTRVISSQTDFDSKRTRLRTRLGSRSIRDSR